MLTKETLNILKLITSTIAPILTFILALLGGFTEKKKDKEFKNGKVTYTKKILTPYGKTIITLLILSALLTLSGVYVDKLINDNKAQFQQELDKINNEKRDSILNTAKSTLDSVILALKTTQEIQTTAQQTTDKVKSVLKMQNQQLELANSININVDPIDSLFVHPQLVLKDEDDILNLNKNIHGNTGDYSPTSGYKEFEIRLYLFGPNTSKKQALDNLNLDFYKHPDALGGIIKNIDLYDYILIDKPDTSFAFISYMQDIYKGVIFNWTQKGRYVASNSKLSFNSLKDTYFIASIRGNRNYFYLNNLSIMNYSKTSGYGVDIQFLKKFEYDGMYSHIYHTMFLGKFISEKYVKDNF